jgi:hypothetical protein
LQPALLPLLRIIEELTREIQFYDRLVAKKGRDGVSGDPGHPDDSRRRLADRADVRAGPCVTKLRELEDFHF